jgi:3-isopropylmalate/(R)-2-methylmalate dehydratase small subunit
VEPVERISGTALPLGYSDVDTDQIVPSDALKRIERTGFGQFLFSGWREDEDFIMHREEHKDAVILIAGENFGSGSSREHAVWAIQDHGFGAVIAPSFADIFRNNSTKNGLLAIDLPEETVENLLQAVREDPETVITIELDELTVTAPNVHETFEMDDFTRRRIMEGLDDISLTLTHEDRAVELFEGRLRWLRRCCTRRTFLPWQQPGATMTRRPKRRVRCWKSRSWSRARRVWDGTAGDGWRWRSRTSATLVSTAPTTSPTNGRVSTGMAWSCGLRSRGLRRKPAA